jgi:hypothetical protein
VNSCNVTVSRGAFSEQEHEQEPPGAIKAENLCIRIACMLVIVKVKAHVIG